ncbi:MAG: electron transfer flavoprotein subunit beta/FixA family protein [Firmicutes bacterium]|jgi:electron transfer flavoprotein beta subunit|nr:electron transfer flavoprotein subunit beta/FixA family protein [Bacillota bacterium]MDH7495348.1 electron transfer flavoprotein subunit beta/FixA family protein [Bacillota bacterium]
MNVAVLIKQVPETTDVKINRETNTLMREGVASIINPFDMYAIEEALRIRERHGGKVTVITMGPPQAEEALRQALALGADEAVLLSDRAFAGADTLATSYTLAKAIEKSGGFDLIVCGKQASDGDTAQVGPEVAENLDIPHVTYVRRIEDLSPGAGPAAGSVEHGPGGAGDSAGCCGDRERGLARGFIRVQRMTEEGYEVIESPLPALITVVKEINEPRMPSIKGMLKAKKAAITTWTAADLGVDPDRVGLVGSPTRVIRVFTPEQKRRGEIIEGETIHEKVRILVSKLKETHLV